MIKLKTFFISSFLCITFFASGQSNLVSNKTEKWTFGTILASEHNWQPQLNSRFMPHLFSGIIAKRNLQHFSIRVRLEHFTEIYDPNNYDSYIYIDGFKRETNFRLGIEKGYIIKQVFKPTIALDIFSSKSYSDTYGGGGFTGYFYQTYINSLSIGLCPAIGVEFFMSEKLSLSLESNLGFIWSKRNIEQANLTRDEDFERRTDNYYFKSINVLGAFSLNYHF